MIMILLEIYLSIISSIGVYTLEMYQEWCFLNVKDEISWMMVFVCGGHYLKTTFVLLKAFNFLQIIKFLRATQWFF